jgi:hypothetical protein
MGLRMALGWCFKEDKKEPARVPENKKEDKKDTPIADFALARIFQKTGGIDTTIAYKHGYASYFYDSIIISHIEKKKYQDSPDLYDSELRTRLNYSSKREDYSKGVNLSRDTYINGKYQEKMSISIGFGYTMPYGYNLDDPVNCTFFLENWESFVKACDDIAEQIKKDCPEDYFKSEKVGCKAKILEKIKETNDSIY